MNTRSKKPTWRQKADALKALGKRVNMDNDGCSGAPDFNFKKCCVEHDFYYRNCESITGVSRWEADKLLRQCIRKNWKLPFMPWLYWIGVRSAGWIPWRKNQKRIDSGEIPKLNTVMKEEDIGGWYE
jgi:hypothetical protein